MDWMRFSSVAHGIHAFRDTCTSVYVVPNDISAGAVLVMGEAGLVAVGVVAVGAVADVGVGLGA